MTNIDFEILREFQARIRSVIESVLAPQNVLAIQSRIKSEDSIIRKLLQKGLKDIHDLRDVVGFRIIVAQDIDIEPTLLAISSEFVVHDGDKIRYTRTNNPYGFVHINVSVSAQRAVLPEWRSFTAYNAEIQILSVRAEARLNAEHVLQYKGSGEGAPQTAATVRLEPGESERTVGESARQSAATIQVSSRLSIKLKEFEALLDQPSIHEKRDIHPFLNENSFLIHPNPEAIF